MALVLDEQQAMCQASARNFIADKAPVAHLRKLRDSRDADGFSRDLWKEFAEMGFTGVLVPEDHSGLGLGNVEAGTIMEEIGRNLTPSPFLSTAVVGVSALLRANGERKSELLPKIAAGEVLMALAVDERAKHGPRQIALAAKRSGNGFALSGTKTFVVYGHVAVLLIVAARTSGWPVGIAV